MEPAKKALSEAIAGLYMPPPPAIYVEMWGGSPEDYMPTINLMECMVEPFNFFSRLDSQWRAGPGGIIGLDYNIIPMMAELFGVKVSRELMQDISVMESAALREVHSKG